MDAYVGRHSSRVSEEGLLVRWHWAALEAACPAQAAVKSNMGAALTICTFQLAKCSQASTL